MIIYHVQIRIAKKVIIELVRDENSWVLAHWPPLKFLSKKDQPFLDEEDLENIKKTMEDTLTDGQMPQRLGSVQLELVLEEKEGVRLQFGEDKVVGRWDPLNGLKLNTGIHPILHKDRAYIARMCAEIPAQHGGIFNPPEEL